MTARVPAVKRLWALLALTPLAFVGVGSGQPAQALSCEVAMIVAACITAVATIVGSIASKDD